MTQGTKRKADVLEESAFEPETNGFYIKHAPDKAMTGVEQKMTRLCASVAGQIYNSSEASDFDLSIEGEIKADVVHFEDHGTPYEDVTPNFAVVVSGSTMILGWQGSTTISDFITDFHMVPVLSSRWSKVSKEIKVHGGFISIIENDLALLDTTIVQKMKDNKITELIMTGHSLGGALGQVAQLCVQAALHDETSIWSQYKKNTPDFIVRTVAFSAPMSISTVAPTSLETTNFLKEVAAKSCNIIYHLDVVPRGFSQLEFIDGALKNIIDGIDGSAVFKSLGIPSLASIFVNVQDQVLDLYKEVKDNKSTQNIVEVAKTFNHYGNIIYYGSNAAQPVMYRDFNHDKASCDKSFSDLKWEPQDDRMDLVGNLTHDHNNTVRGPGLAYKIPDEKLAGKCYMMDEFEVLKNFNDVGSPIPFTSFSDCVKKAKEGMHSASYAAVAVWEKSENGKEKFKMPGTLYIKKCVPGKSEDAKSVGAGFWNKGVKNKATFWRTACLGDWVEERSPAADIHDGVVELK